MIMKARSPSFGIVAIPGTIADNIFFGVTGYGKVDAIVIAESDSSQLVDITHHHIRGSMCNTTLTSAGFLFRM